MYKGQIMDYSLENGNTVRNPKATFTIIQGNGGNRNMEKDEQEELISSTDWLLY